MEYRQFWLVNTLGDRYDFTKDCSVFLESPQGLGFRKVYTSMTVGNSELVTSQQFSLTDIQGNLLFMDSKNGTKYQKYQDFIQFAKYKPLEFHYLTPNDLTSYHCDVIFVQANKSEVSTNGILNVPVIFHRLTEWLTDKDEAFVMDNNPLDEGKYHDLIYDYHYAGTNLSNTPITNKGTDDVGFILEIDAPNGVQNPQFTLSQGGETYGICKINGTYTYVRVDSVERTESMYLEDNGSAVTNPEQYQDFTVTNGQSYLTWLKLRVGTSTFSFTCGNIDTFDGTVTLRFKNSYASV